MAARKGRGVLVTIIGTEGSVPRRPGSKMLVKEDGETVGTVGGGDVELWATHKAKGLMSSENPKLVHFDLAGNEVPEAAAGGRVDIFFEPVVYPETLYIFGAGHVAQPLAAIGDMLGFRVVVIDPRPEFNNEERFPRASLVLQDITDSLVSLNIRENDYIVVATPSHRLDKERLDLALTTNANYIGMVGSKRKMAQFREHLTAKGVLVERLDFVHTPIGLDIGAETPEEIAVSIMAEIVAVRRGKETKKE
jgi:xanthine dehydrogenase accessory factor